MYVHVPSTKPSEAVRSFPAYLARPVLRTLCRSCTCQARAAQIARAVRRASPVPPKAHGGRRDQSHAPCAQLFQRGCSRLKHNKVHQDYLPSGCLNKHVQAFLGISRVKMG